MSTLQAVILTGSRNQHNALLKAVPPSPEADEVQHKVLLPVCGVPMLTRVIETLQQSNGVSQVLISGNDPVIRAHPPCAALPFVPGGETAVKSFLQAVQHAPTEGWVLLASGDHPLLTTQMVNYFVETTQAANPAIAAAVVRKSVIQKEYPQAKRTYFPIKGDSISGGNLFLVNKKLFMANTTMLQNLDNNRKKPWKNLSMANPITALRLLLRQLDLPELSAEMTKAMGCGALLVDIPYADCAMDVDKPLDWEMAEVVLNRRANGGAQSHPGAQQSAISSAAVL